MVRPIAEIRQMTGGEQGQGHDLGGLDWRDGVIPVSRRFDDPYFSLNDGLAETGHVFLAGNNLPARLTPGFQVAELGFGTGLNLLALHLCREYHGHLRGIILLLLSLALLAPLPLADTLKAL
jgi:tRNA U34 5-methylaminomethyl-2-thiouridine-forming methyltransferase MnmC